MARSDPGGRAGPARTPARVPVPAFLLTPLAVALAFLALGPVSSWAQSIDFGKNKVQYSDFHWQVLKSDHFQLYFYKEETGLAEQALGMAEAAYTELRPRFARDVTRPIPLIVYSTHQDFEQNNITPFFLPEGVAGLTEFAKGRVLIPFDGSLSNFRTTIQHELVHVFQMACEEQSDREHYKQAPLTPPLWFTEGLAVHWSETRDPEADMVLRDMVVSGHLPAIDEFWRYEGGYTTYKLGQSVIDYIGATYGEDRIRLFYDRLWAFKDFAALTHDVLGISQADLSERWIYMLRQRYYPQVSQAEPAGLTGQGLTVSGADFKPLPLPSHLPGYPHHFAFMSPRNGFTNIYTASLEEGGEHDVKTLVEGERRPEFESFHAFRSRMDVSEDGLLLFVSKNQGTDEVVVYSIGKKGVVERHGFPNLVGLSSPAWAGGSGRFLFSGLSKDGYSDLFLYDRNAKQLTRLTNDRYQDLEPTYCSWRDAVVWSSDRTPYGERGAHNLFLMDLKSGNIRYLTRGRWNDVTPVCDPDSHGILCVSDRDGFYNVYKIDEGGKGHRLTHSLDGIFDPRPVPGEHRFLATVYKDGGFRVRSFAISDTSGPQIALAAADSTPQWDWRATAPQVAAKVGRYKPHFTLDVAQGGVGVDPNLRTGEGLQAAFSDMMGNHLIYVGLGNTAFSTSHFLRNFSASATYLNLTHRMNYGVTAFHYAGDYYDEIGNPYYEQRVGMGALLRYPLSKFERVETNLSLGYLETDRPWTGYRGNGGFVSQSVSFIRDTSLWESTGPIDGQRLNLTAGVTMGLKNGGAQNTMLIADWRRYQRLGLLSTYAVRLQGRWSEGDNPETYTLGGSLSLRAWPRQAFWGNRSFLFNQEIRFPLVRGLALGLPMGNLELPGIQGAIFLDAGSAWSKGTPDNVYGSYGVGLRMGLGGFAVLRLDVGRQTDFKSFPSHTQSQLYVGWNY